MPRVPQDDYVGPVAKDKGKERSSVADARSLSIEALQDAVAKDIRRVADLAGLQVSASDQFVVQRIEGHPSRQ